MYFTNDDDDDVPTCAYFRQLSTCAVFTLFTAYTIQWVTVVLLNVYVRRLTASYLQVTKVTCTLDVGTVDQ